MIAGRCNRTRAHKRARASHACGMAVLLSLPGLARAQEESATGAEPAAPERSAATGAEAMPAVAAPMPAPAQPAPTVIPPAPAPAPAQRPSPHGISVRLGVRAETVREDLLVPLTFSGGGLDAGGSYYRQVGRGLLDARLEAGMAIVSNRFGHLGVVYHHALAIAYRLPLPTTRAWRFALGGVIGESTDVLALDSWDDSHDYWVGLGWLGPSATLQGPLGKGWQLVALGELALVGTVGRPPEFRTNKQDALHRPSYYAFHPLGHPSVFGPWDVQFVRFDVAVRQSVSELQGRHGWSFGCQGRFLRASEPATILVLEAVLYAELRWGR